MKDHFKRKTKRTQNKKNDEIKDDIKIMRGHEENNVVIMSICKEI